MLFLELLKLNLKVNFHYRWSFLVSIFIDPILLFIFVSLISSIFQNTHEETIVGYNCTQMIWYMGAIKFFYYLVWSSPDSELTTNVLNGTLTVRLLKPVSIIKWEFVRAVSLKLCSFILEFLPAFCIYSLIAFPSFMTIEGCIKYLILSMLSFILFFFISFILGEFSLLFQSTEAIISMKMLIVNLFAGALIPIEFLPDKLQLIIKILPFQYLFYVPIQFLLNMPGTQDWKSFGIVSGILLFWIVIFAIITFSLWQILLKKYVSAGG